MSGTAEVNHSGQYYIDKLINYLTGAFKNNDDELVRTIVTGSDRMLEIALTSARDGNKANLEDFIMDESFIQYQDINKLLITACEHNNIDLVKALIKKGATDWNEGMLKACKHGCLEIVKLMIENGGNNWNYGLRAGCRYNHLEIVKLMISNGAQVLDKEPRETNIYIEDNPWCIFHRHNKNSWNYNTGLESACESGNVEIVELFIIQGANDWNEGLQTACNLGHVEVAELLITHGADDWSNGLLHACAGGRTETAKLMIKHGNNIDDNIFDIGLRYACQIGELEERECVKLNRYWNKDMYELCWRGRVNIVELMITNGADGFERGLYEACSNGCAEIVDLIIKYMDREDYENSVSIDDFHIYNDDDDEKFSSFYSPSGPMAETKLIEMLNVLITNDGIYHDDYNEFMRIGSSKGYLKLVKLMIDHHAYNFGECLLEACKYCDDDDENWHNVDGHFVNTQIVELLIRHGLEDREHRVNWSGVSGNIEYIGGSNDVVELIVKNGIMEANDGLLLCINKKGFNKKLKIMIKYGATNMDEGLLMICKDGWCSETLEILLEGGAKNINEGLLAVCGNRHRHKSVEIAKLLIKYGANVLDEGLKMAHESKNLNLVKLLESMTNKTC